MNKYLGYHPEDILLQAFSDYGVDMNRKDRLQFIIELRDYLAAGHGAELAKRLTKWIKQHVDDCIEEDICPYCGGELAVHQYMEARPWGNTVAYEHLSELYCQTCATHI